MLRKLPEGHPTGTFTPYDWQAPGQTIPGRFAEIADRFPDRLATFDFARRLTYGELDRAANRVANVLLAACGGSPEAIIILAGVNTAATVAALGVFRANKFFVALEPSFPPARARQIIADTLATVILAESEHLALARELAPPGHRIIDLDAMTAGDDGRPDVQIDPGAIALLNYTSGSAGQPKGVVQTHRSALAHAARYANAYHLSDADRMMKTESLAWAGTFWDVFGTLCLGACVASYDVTRHGMHRLPRWVRETGVTAMSGMTMIIRLARYYPEESYGGVLLLQLGGDSLRATQILPRDRPVRRADRTPRAAANTDGRRHGGRHPAAAGRAAGCRRAGADAKRAGRRAGGQRMTERGRRHGCRPLPPAGKPFPHARYRRPPK